MFKDLRSKIIFSIAYTDQFKYPLTKEEIFLRFLGSDSSTTLKNIEHELNKMVSSGIVYFKKGFYFLKGGESFVETRLKRKVYSQKKWLEVEEFVGFVRNIPWIKAIVITGSLAVDNAKENDDVDFMIIAEKQRLWLARIFVAVFTFIKGKKRSWDREKANSWCLNLWLDEDSLKLPERLRNIYGAFEVCQAVWAYDKNNTKKNFFKLNGWAKNYLPEYFEYQKNSQPKAVSSSGRNLGIFEILLTGLNNLLFLLQYLYMRPHMTKEKVAVSYAFFHPRDTKKQIFGKWLRKFKETTE